MTGVLVALVQVKGATCAEREAGSVSLAIQSVCRPTTVVVMETGGSLLVVIQGWVYRGSVCAEWWCGRVELRGFMCLERWCGVLGVEGCSGVKSRGSVCLGGWCGVLGVEGCSRVELRGSLCLKRWCGVLGVEGCSRVELRGSLCLKRWCGVLGVEGCGRVELRIWFFSSSNSARRASMAALSKERRKR